jgi:MFS family permease
MRPEGNSRALWRTGTLIYTTAGLVSLFFWLLGGDFSYYLKERSVVPAMQLLLHRLHVSNLLVGILLVSLPAAIGLVVMPVVAYRSDRHRGRWGRRIPFLIAPIPLTLAAMLGLAFSPAIGREIHRALGRWSPGENTSEIVALAGSWALFEVCTTISNSVFLSLITDVVPRKVIGQFFALFRMVSLGAGMLFQYFLFGQIEQHCVPIFLGIGAVYCLGFTAMCWKVKEGGYPPPPGEVPPGGTKEGLLIRRFVGGVKIYCRDCFTLPYYRWVFLSFALPYLAGGAFSSFYVLYAKSLGMSMAKLGKYGALQFLLSLLQAYPIGWLADRFHPLRLTIAALVMLVVSTLVAFFLVRDATGFGIALVGCGSLSGFWLTATASLPSVLFPHAKFAVFNSARLTLTSVATMIAGAACGWMLDRLHHDYHYLFLWWFSFMSVAFFVTLAVYRGFVRYGGQGNYIAPE